MPEPEVVHPETAGGLGSVALSDEEQAKLTALNDDPSHPRGNIDLALDMADVGKGAADTAANYREAVDLVDSYEKPENLDLGDDERREKNRLYDRLIPILSDVDPLTGHHNTADIVNKAIDRSKQEAVEKLRDIAEKNDIDADTLMEWARILHIHPPSEAYKKAHPGVSFTPEGLRNIKELEYRRSGELAEIKSLIEHSEDGGWLRDELQARISRVDEELEELLNNPETTNRDYINLFKRRLEGRAKRVQASIDEIGSMFDDMRTGRASQGYEASPEDADKAGIHKLASYGEEVTAAVEEHREKYGDSS